MDYSYYFADFTDDKESVRVIHHLINREYQIKVRVDDRELIKTNACRVIPIAADLVDVAVAVYIADWLSPQKEDRPHDIYINLPLRHPDVFRRPSVYTCLQKLLRWYTQNNWHFVFKSRTKLGRVTECTQKLHLPTDNIPVEVSLWSGGLDSLAGLYNRSVQRTSASYELIGIGNGKYTQGKQKEIANAVMEDRNLRIKLIQLPIQLHYSKPQPPRNPSFRVRGFTFKLIGAVCAFLEEQQKLYVYENGFGAINLPYLLSEIGLAHTRSVHPNSVDHES